jgi:hypothetical protein
LVAAIATALSAVNASDWVDIYWTGEACAPNGVISMQVYDGFNA